jgi:hypothetical protein
MRISPSSLVPTENLSQLMRLGDSSNAPIGSKQAGIANAVMDLTQIMGSDAPEKVKVQAMQERAALAVADYYTGGMASIVHGWAERQWGGTLDKLRNLQAKFDPMVQIAGLFDSNKWQTEGKRLKGLIEQGIDIPESLRGAMHLTRGRSLEELVDASVPQDFIGFKSDGTWVNNQFAATRDETYLKPQDIWGSAACFERFGNDWLGKFSEEQRRSICQQALDLGLVREHRGTIDIAWDKLPQSALQ